jgi:hypothetical protein
MNPKTLIQSAVIQAKLYQYGREFRRNEGFVGIRPSIQEYGPFLRGYESSNMSEKWQKNGIPINGNNYWTLGKPSNVGSSSRFDPNSNMYQALFGVYTHLGTDGKQFGMKDKEPDLEILRSLAEVDQECWLSAYGDNSPFAKLWTFGGVGKLKVDGRDAWLYYGEMVSHSDVGFTGKGYEGAFGAVRNKKLVLAPKETASERLFVPDKVLWQGHVDPYHRVNLKGYFAVVPLEKAIACIYLNGVEYEDNHSRRRDTWIRLRPYAIDMIRSVKIGAV